MAWTLILETCAKNFQPAARLGIDMLSSLIAKMKELVATLGHVPKCTLHIYACCSLFTVGSVVY